MGTRWSDLAAPHRTRKCRRSQSRSRARLCGFQRGLGPGNAGSVDVDQTRCFQAKSRKTPDIGHQNVECQAFAGSFVDNNLFTMRPELRRPSANSVAPQVPLYLCWLVLSEGTVTAAMRFRCPGV